MIRFLVSAVIWVASAALGLFVAQSVLDDMSVDTLSFVVVAAIFAILQAVLSPFILKMAVRYAPPIVGGIGLVSTFVALAITAAVTDGLSIEGADTWVFASLIVWLVTMVATLLLPLLLAKTALMRRANGDGARRS
jgi:putative membrane protein